MESKSDKLSKARHELSEMYEGTRHHGRKGQIYWGNWLGENDWWFEIVFDALQEDKYRQSATSEEVTEAIAKIEKIVAFDNEHGYRVNNCHSMHIRDIKTALVALQAYQPTISKTETTTCEWCKGVVGEFFDVLWYDFVNRKRGSVNYCPNCGRRLED